jgi:hypothetical protein
VGKGWCGFGNRRYAACSLAWGCRTSVFFAPLGAERLSLLPGRVLKVFQQDGASSFGMLRIPGAPGVGVPYRARSESRVEPSCLVQMPLDGLDFAELRQCGAQ